LDGTGGVGEQRRHAGVVRVVVEELEHRRQTVVVGAERVGVEQPQVCRGRPGRAGVVPLPESHVLRQLDHLRARPRLEDPIGVECRRGVVDEDHLG
jgi:hypothetical protein